MAASPLPTVSSVDLAVAASLVLRHALAECVRLVLVRAVPIGERVRAQEVTLGLTELGGVREVAALRLSHGDPQVHAGDRRARGQGRGPQVWTVVLGDLDPDPVASRETPAVALKLVRDRAAQ